MQGQKIGFRKLLILIADYAVRLIAIAGLFLWFPALFIASIMAGPFALLILAILAVGAVVLAGLILFSNKGYMRGAAYLIAIVAVVWTIKDHRDDQKYGPPVLKIPASDAAYPRALNPSPQWLIRVSGELPTSVPLKGFIAHYMTNEGHSDLQHRDATCTRTQASPYAPTAVQSLEYDEVINPRISNGQYEVIFVVDKFIDTPCAWRMKSVDFTVVGSQYSSRVVDLRDGNDNHAIPGVNEDQNRFDLWCRERVMPNQAPIHPITDCSSFPGSPGVTLRVSLESLVPSSQRPNYSSIILHAPQSSLELDFHDYDKMVKENQLEPGSH